MVIADDEWLIRESIIHGIEWADLGVEIVGVCSDGLEALDNIIETEPHILLTDIRMPGLNGLELIKAAKIRIPHLKTVIISGFSEFEYAQQALKIGVDDYLLKPIIDQDLVNIISKLSSQSIAELKGSPDKVNNDLLRILLREIEPGDFMEKQNIKGKFAVICWDGKTSLGLKISEPGVRILPGGIMFIEEANSKVDFLKNLNQLFVKDNILAGGSSFSNNFEDLPKLLKQAQWAREQNRGSQRYGLSMQEETNSPINIEEVFEYINNHYQEPITLQSLASKFFISDSYFSRIFKQHTGKNFIEYLTVYRIEIAKNMLAYSGMKPSEVCKAVGYTDQRYFSQIFKKITGTTPSQFKNKR